MISRRDFLCATPVVAGALAFTTSVDGEYPYSVKIKGTDRNASSSVVRFNGVWLGFCIRAERTGRNGTVEILVCTSEGRPIINKDGLATRVLHGNVELWANNRRFPNYEERLVPLSGGGYMPIHVYGKSIPDGFERFG